MIVCSLLLTLCLSPTPQDPDSTVSLFNGTSLDGWSGDPRFWSVEDGEIVGRSSAETPCVESTYLVFETAEFADFDLSVDYRIDSGNSGVQFRSERVGEWKVAGYQADLEAGPDWTGGIYEEEGRGVLVRRSLRLYVNGANSAYELVGDRAELSKLGGAREWHTYRIRAEGTRVRLWIDGTLTAELDDRDPKARGSGVLALQIHPGPPTEVRYRNLKITPLEDVPETLPQWIWSPEGTQEDQMVQLVRIVKGGPGLVKATLWATCDNGVEISLDDRVFAAGADWSRPFEVELAPRLVKRLVDGKPHRLEAECWNTGGAAGFIARLALEYEDGRIEVVETDRWWRTEDGKTPVRVIGPYGCEPWGELTGRSSGSPDLTLLASKIELPPGFVAEDLLRVPRTYGSWVALTVDDKGRIIAAAEAQHGLFRLTLDETDVTDVEPLDLEITAAQGLAAVGSDLYIVQNDWKSDANGLYRARDLDGDDHYEVLELLRKLDGSGEHGAHAVRLTPDGQHLQIIAGNSTRIPSPISTYHVAPMWFDDQVLPSLPDTFGHGNQMHLHGGWTAICDLDGKNWEVIATGMRNAYDFAYDEDGNAFAYDADMEWDIGAPWYRAPRVVHLAPGLEFGWRRGSGKIDASAPETFGPVCTTGPSSPVGVLHGKDSSFHAPFHRQLFIGDWTRGTIYAVDMERDRDVFVGEPKPFLIGRPFPITDMEWLPDGSMVIVTGGRGRRSALYRIRSTIGPPEESSVSDAPVEPGPLAQRQARARLELDPDMDVWAARAIKDGDPQALLALSRVGGAQWQPAVLEAVLASPELLDRVAIRTIELSLARYGDPSRSISEALRSRLEVTLPTGFDLAFSDERTNVALIELLVRLKSPVAPAFAVPRMEAAETQEVVLDYALALRLCDEGWTESLAVRYLDMLHIDALTFAGGRSLQGYVARIREEALPRAGRAIDGGYVPPEAPDRTATRDVRALLFVREWTLDDLVPVLDYLDQAKNREIGELAFRRAGCYACHRVGEEGGGAGPDLTDAGARFTPRDLLITILEPSRDVSDQYRDTEIWTHDGEVFVGRLVESDEEWVSVQLPPSEPGGTDGDIVDVPVEDAKLVRPSPTSRMPRGSLDGLINTEILEMLAWLLDQR